MRGTMTRNLDPWWSTLSLPAVLIVPAMLLVQSARGDNTTCVSDQLSWYTSVVGESPCMTYQRLRQICNNKYQAPIFSSTVPGDRCDDVGESGCCCNTIAFQLSMLCLNCQQDTQDGGAGIDAPENGYSVYTDSCSPIFNHTLPDDIQSTVCNENIRLDDFLYAGWDDGSWFYLFTKENAESAHAADSNNTFTHCADQTSSSLAPTTPTTSRTATAIARTSGLSSTSTLLSNTATPVQPSTTTTNTNVPGAGHARSKPNARAPLIGGIVAGGAVALAIVLAVTVAAMRRRRRRRARGRGLQQIRDSSDRLNLSHESSPPPTASVRHGPPLLPAASCRSGTDGNSHGLGEYSTCPPSPSAHPAVQSRIPVTVPPPLPSAQRTVLSTEFPLTVTGRAGSGAPFFHLAPLVLATGTHSNRTTGTVSGIGEVGMALETPLRHDDGGPLTAVLPALARSSSGRLPPAYDESWDGGGGGGTRAGGQRQRTRTRTGRRGTGPLTTTNGLAAGAVAMDSEVHEPSSESIDRVRVGGRVRLLPGAKDG